MRDNHEKMPELLRPAKRDQGCFAIVRLERDGINRDYEFPVDNVGYNVLSRAFDLRPLGNIPGQHSRVFFVPAVRRLDDDRVMMTVRVEQGARGKQVEVEAPRALVANLMWFFKLQDWNAAEYLRVRS
jgi:hypothetical protein